MLNCGQKMPYSITMSSIVLIVGLPDNSLFDNMMSTGANLLESRGFENTSVFNEGGIVPLPNEARR